MSGGPVIGKLSQLSVQEPLFFCVGCSFNLKLFPEMGTRRAMYYMIM